MNGAGVTFRSRQSLPWPGLGAPRDVEIWVIARVCYRFSTRTLPDVWLKGRDRDSWIVQLSSRQRAIGAHNPRGRSTTSFLDLTVTDRSPTSGDGRRSVSLSNPLRATSADTAWVNGLGCSTKGSLLGKRERLRLKVIYTLNFTFSLPHRLTPTAPPP